MKLAVIIPFFEGENVIDRCIQSLQGIDPMHIYVVDNSPTPLINTWEINHIQTGKQKMGFGAAINYGFKKIIHAGYDFLLVLNQDAFFKKGHFAKLFDYLKHTSEKGFISPLIFKEDFSEIMPFLDYRYQLNSRKNNDEIFLQDFVAVALVIPTELFIDLQGFDERFFMYYEDTDLIARAQLKNPVRILPKIHVGHHNPDLESDVRNPEKEQWIEKSRLLYLKKHKSWHLWSIAWVKSRLRKLKNAIFGGNLRNNSQQ